MAVTVASDGSQTATIGTEHTLFDSTAAATYQLAVDPAAMVAGDVLEIRVYKMTRAAGTRRVVYYVRYDGAQPTDDMEKVSVPVSCGITDSGAIRFTLTQTKGTGRAYPWTVEKFA